MTDPFVPNYTVSPNGYLLFPVDVDPNVLMADELANIAAAYPGWVPYEGHLEVALLESFARMCAERSAVDAQVPIGIFTFYGGLVGITPELGAAATCTTTWTMVDNQGYTIPAGTNVGFQVTGSELILFTTETTVTVPPSATTATGVTIQAGVAGIAANGIAEGAVTLIDSLAFVTGIVSTSITSGGANPETLTAYLNRLSAELQLLTPRPILPPDFAALAVNIVGVARALAVNGYNAPRTFTDAALLFNVCTSLTAMFVTADIGRGISDGAPGTGDIPGGTTVTAVQSPSSATPWAATAAYTHGQILRPTVPNGLLYQCSVAGNSGSSEPTWPTITGNTVANGTATFQCLGAATACTMSANNFGTPTNDTVTLAAMTAQERTVGVAVVDINGAALNATIMGEVSAYLESLREVNFIVSVFAPTYTTITVDCNVVVTTGSSTTAVQAAVVAAVTAYLSPANWAGGTLSPPQWISGPDGSATVRYLSVAGVIEAVPGVDHITAGTLTVNTGTADVTLSGEAPLPQNGTHVITASVS